MKQKIKNTKNLVTTETILFGCAKGVKTVEKSSFVNNIGILISTQENNNFKRKIFPIKYLDQVSTFYQILRK